MRVFRGFVFWLVLSSLTIVSAFPAGTGVSPENQEITRSDRELLAFTFPEGTAVIIPFQGTERLPEARGQASVERREEVTELDIELENVRPARLFGGDFNIYALWLVAPGGVVDNAGQVRFSGDKGYLRVATALGTFGMLITAEPHSMVRLPSSVVVLENRHPEESLAELRSLPVSFEGYAGEYQSVRESLTENMDEEIEPRNPLDEARTAINLAERAGARQHAPGKVRLAEAALERAEEAARTGSRRGEVIAQSREAIIWASEAQIQAERITEQALPGEEVPADRVDSPVAWADEPRPQPQETPSDPVREETIMPIGDSPVSQWGQLRKAFGDLLEVRETDRTLLLDLPETLFEPDDAVLTARGREVLSRIAGALHVLNGMRVGLEGPRQVEDAELAGQRIEAVRAYFLESGMPADMLTEIELDEPDPVPSAEAERAVLVVLRAGEALAPTE
jgi:outer membrane protein OmpA-like peptidoglycan-associated protein